MKAFFALTFMASSVYANLCQLPKDSIVRIKSDVIFTANTAIYSLNKNDGNYSGCQFRFSASPSDRVLRQGRDLIVQQVGRFHYSGSCDAHLVANDKSFFLICDDEITLNDLRNVSNTLEIIPAAPIEF